MTTRVATRAQEAARIARQGFVIVSAKSRSTPKARVPSPKEFIDSMIRALEESTSTAKSLKTAAEILRKFDQEFLKDDIADIEAFGADLHSFILDETRILDTAHSNQMLAIHSQIMSAVKGQPFTDSAGRQLSL